MATIEDEQIKFTSTLLICTLHPTLSCMFMFWFPHAELYRKEFFIVFGALLFLTLFFLVTSHIKKGFVRAHAEELPLLRERISRYCRKCQNIKPERAHHCRRCKRCIKKMDHHCPWIGACVNNDNLAHFIRFTTLGAATEIMQGLYLSYTVILLLKEGTHAANKVGIVLGAALAFSSFFIAFVGISFSYLNVKNALKNITFIESSMLDDLRLYGMECPKSPYDLGWYENLTSILGKPYFLFLFGESSCDGMSFRKTYDIERWPPLRIPKWGSFETDV